MKNLAVIAGAGLILYVIFSGRVRYVWGESTFEGRASGLSDALSFALLAGLLSGGVWLADEYEHDVGLTLAAIVLLVTLAAHLDAIDELGALVGA